MKCPETGIIQAYMDGELDIGARKDVESHIGACPKCSGTFSRLKEADDYVFEKMAAYGKHIAENPAVPPKRIQLPRQAERMPGIAQETATGNPAAASKGVIDFMRRYRRLTAAACVILIAVACLTIQPVRAAISDALKILRVDKLEGISISPREIAQIKEGLEKGGDINIRNLGRIEISGGSAKNATFDDLAFYGITAVKPGAASLSDPEIRLMEPAKIAFTLDTVKANKVLKSFNAASLLPDEINGKTFTADFGAQACIIYETGGVTYTVYETTTPKMQVPEGVDVDTVFNALASIPVFPDAFKTKLKSIGDWKSTLYIPVFEDNGNGISEVNINGKPGYVVSGNKAGGESHSGLIWMENGMIYGVEANAGSDQLVKFAESLK